MSITYRASSNDNKSYTIKVEDISSLKTLVTILVLHDYFIEDIDFYSYEAKELVSTLLEIINVGK